MRLLDGESDFMSVFGKAHIITHLWVFGEWVRDISVWWSYYWVVCELLGIPPAGQRSFPVWNSTIVCPSPPGNEWVLTSGWVNIQSNQTLTIAILHGEHTASDLVEPLALDPHLPRRCVVILQRWDTHWRLAESTALGLETRFDSRLRRGQEIKLNLSYRAYRWLDWKIRLNHCVIGLGTDRKLGWAWTFSGCFSI